MRWLLAIVLTMATTLSAAAEEARLALIIANKGYQEAVGPLINPHNDAALIETSLKNHGFAPRIVQTPAEARSSPPSASSPAASATLAARRSTFSITPATAQPNREPTTTTSSRSSSPMRPLTLSGATASGSTKCAAFCASGRPLRPISSSSTPAARSCNLA